MAYNDKKILQVMKVKLGEMDEEYEGYTSELLRLLEDVLTIEREHRISKTNVVQKIAERINTVGLNLYRSRNTNCVEE